MNSAATFYARRAVLEWSSGFGPATVAAKLLADLGCPVYKIEPLAGDALREGRRAPPADMDLYHLFSGSKHSVCVDVAARGARDVVMAALAQMDIVVVDGAGWIDLQRLVSAAELASDFPNLTIAVISPFGARGSLAHWTAGEETLQAISGVMSTTGHPQRPPVRVAGAIVTHATAMYAVTSILADLRAKQASGRGAHLDMAMFDGAISLLTSAFPVYFLSGAAPPGIGNRHSMAAPWNTYRASDGWVVVCAGNEPTWQRLIAAVDRPELGQDPRYATQEARVQNVAALDAEIEAWTTTRTAAEVEAALDAKGIPSGPILPLSEVLAHAQFAARRLAVTDKGVTLTGGAFHRDKLPLELRAGTCALGAATRDLLLERCGVERSRYDRWLRDGAIAEHAKDAHAAAA